MAQHWVLTPRKRAMLGALDALAPALASRRGGATADGFVRHVLVIELWNIGDVVLAMPFLAQLRARFPKARVTLLARPHARALLEGTGLVDEIVETDLTWRHADRNAAPLSYNWHELLRVRRELGARRFDLAFQCRMLVRERLILAMSGATRRVGYAFGVGDRTLTDALPVDDPDRHRVDDWMRLLLPFGGPVAAEEAALVVTPEERSRADARLAALGLGPEERIVGIHPGASVPEKRWPLDRFAVVAQALAARAGHRVLAFVEPGGYGASLATIPGVVALGEVSLRELVALLARCDTLVCNDSGPMHIAGALGVPTVAVFEPGIARWFAPLGAGHEIVERDAATVPAVIAAVERVLDRATGAEGAAHALGRRAAR